jgi:signal transduction histidine kinase/ActR/RegA family two-component response regulator
LSTSLLSFISVVLLAVALVFITAAVRHFWRQARAERHARTETERKLLHTDKLQQLTAILSRARTPLDVLHTCLPEFLHATQASAGVIVVTSDDGSISELAHLVGYSESVAARAKPIPISSRTPVADAIRRRELVVLRSDPLRAAKYPDIALEPWLDGVGAMIAIPLVASSRAIGAVTLTFHEPHQAEEDEREFLANAGRHTAQALDRARLYDAAERARKEAEALRVRADLELRERHKAEEALRRSETKYRTLAARTSRLYALSAGLSEAVTLDAVARAMVTHGKVVVGASAGSVAIVVEGGAAFETLYSEEHALEKPPPRQRFPAERGLCATAAMKTRAPIFVGSFSEWQEKYPRSAALAADGGYASAAVLPLMAENSVKGILSFHFTVPVNFDDEYAALLTSVAQHCAQALDRARLYETTDQAREEAEAANRSKDDFLSTVSHELRTPLNAILGWASMLREGFVDQSRTTRAVEAIFKNATRQGRLIEELLDVSKIVAGRAAIELSEVDLGESLRGAVESMMPLAAREGLDIKFDAPEGITVLADARRLEQVFLNLLSNAVKFTANGGSISVDVTVAGRSAQVRVSDTGTGIEPDFLPHVFERFRQADSSSTRGAGGLGLGLFIARQLVEAQGGTIEAASDGAQRGATFTVKLPLAPKPMARPAIPAHPVEADLAADSLKGVRVLIVDDEPDARELMTAALESFGATAVSVASAADALQTLAGAEFDVLLSDVAMPGRSGYDLIRSIRAAVASRFARIPAAAVTASASDEDRKLTLAAGFQTHISKPVDPAMLANRVAALIREQQPPGAAASYSSI